KGRKDVKLRYEPKDILLVADKVRMGRVISNLLNNAIKFTAKGKITLNTKDIEQNELNNRETKLEQKNEQQS
ncbi:MAG TPA: hypothetical protein VE548_01520, partial [Nitrososphaeraceae archaeon]|nr:hypothetical protein [Nitrososphaeraceae archaeon]